MKEYRSLKFDLFLWYIASLIILVAYFFLFIHFYTLPYGIPIFIFILIVLAITGFIIIYRITQSISDLSTRISKITQKNLGEKIIDIKDKNEIGELADNFNKLMSRLDEAFKRERQFITDVAHEMKTPLTTIKSSMEVALQKDRNTDEYKKMIKDSIEEVDGLSSTLKNVLDLAWSEAPHGQNKMEEIDLTKVMEELFDIAQKLAINKKITVHESIAKNIFIKGFEDRLARAVLNLIDNAVKYTVDKGEIKITLEKVKNDAVIIVEDNGVGIQEEEIPHIFDRFYRGSKTDKIFGAGLGLAICKSIINLHHGNIKVSSKINKGTAFIINLPLSS